MRDNFRNALQYIKNTNGGATKAHFVDDWEPIGELMWQQVEQAGLATVNEAGRVVLTEAGEKEFAS